MEHTKAGDSTLRGERKWKKKEERWAAIYTRKGRRSGSPVTRKMPSVKGDSAGIMFRNPNGD